jgi:hypothetical protein
MLLRILEFGLVFFIILVFITQILIPILRQTPVFPLFRAEEKLSNTLAQTHQKLVEKRIKKDIDTINKREEM